MLKIILMFFVMFILLIEPNVPRRRHAERMRGVIASAVLQAGFSNP